MKFPQLKWPDITPAPPATPTAPLPVRLLWMAAIWSGSVLALAALAGVLRLLLHQ